MGGAPLTFAKVKSDESAPLTLLHFPRPPFPYISVRIDKVEQISTESPTPTFHNTSNWVPKCAFLAPLHRISRIQNLDSVFCIPDTGQAVLPGTALPSALGQSVLVRALRRLRTPSSNF